MEEMKTPSIFINLPVTSLAKAEAFYEALGFKKNITFCSDDTTGMIFSDTIYLMIMVCGLFSIARSCSP